MAENSKIEWCHHSANLWWGCTEVHKGCDKCYARVFSNRYNNGDKSLWGNDKPRKEIKSVWANLRKWQKVAERKGEFHRVFVGSMMDVFEKPMPVIDSKGEMQPYTTGDLRERFFTQVVPECPNLIFLLLTKRPSNINKYIPERWKENPPANVMYGASVVDQKTFNNVMNHLSGVKGKKFLSMEPLLDEVNISYISGPEYCCDGWECGCAGLPIDPPAFLAAGINWIIVGGESGHGRREFNPDWARKIQVDCWSFNIPFFMKQWDKVKPIPEDLMVRQFPEYHLTMNFEPVN